MGLSGKTGIGVAFDVGTTTVAGASVDLATGEVIRSASVPNPQARWGRDVLSRINALSSGKVSLSEMSKAVIGAMDALVPLLGIEAGDVREFTAAGNPIMTHILLGISPEPFSRVPYKPAFTEAKRGRAVDAGLKASKEAVFYTLPFIGGFVGGDAVGVLLSLGLRGGGSPALAIDIGTNSEIMLSANGEVFATSAAAGPAFEAGELEYGMTAQRGAIRGVSLEGERVILDVIETDAPKGICGSGLIEAASTLLKAGVIDRSGRIKERDEVEGGLSSRIKVTKDGNAFALYRGASGEITLSQSDIRALQTAKSATRAGILMLLKKARLTPSDIGKVFIAGAFGSNLNKDALAEIGLLDRDWVDNVEMTGDAALDGAVLALSDDKKLEAEGIAGAARYVSLSGSAHFQEEFIRNINF